MSPWTKKSTNSSSPFTAGSASISSIAARKARLASTTLAWLSLVAMPK